MGKLIAYAYLRVSGQGQITGHGFERQLREIKRFCQSKYRLEKIYKEQISGTISEEKRPVMGTMIADILSNGCDTIIVEDLSRLAREYRIQENILIYLASKKINLVSCTAQSKGWNKQGVGTILSSKAYIGEHCINPGGKDKILVPTPAIIDEETWQQAQLLKQYRVHKPKKRHKGYENHFIADGFIRCGECRSKMVKRVDPRKNGPPKVYYGCYWRRASKKELFISGRKRCILKPIDANEIDRVIINHLIFFITRPPVHKKKVLKMDKRPNETRKRLQLRLRRFRSGARDQCKPD